jgi:LuxR family transcriptional regulator, maltose regulon positive regulatory protein
MVNEDLLQTKLQIPRRRAPGVARARLITRLNGGIESRLILISAPAGFGKTTILTEWLSSSNYPATWFSVDDNDNELTLFMAYFIAALQKIKANLGAIILNLPSLPPNSPVESTLINLINEISTVTDHFVMVIDDYHNIKNVNIHKALAFLIDNLPSNMHLVIASRSDPPLNLAHLRGRGQLTELRVDDLRFTREEITEFLNQVMELNLEEEEITVLNNRSEGWVAGLQMAAITLKGRSDTTGFLKAFSSSSRNMLDYLFEEVFAQQPPEVQSFLLETSILDRLSPALCNAVTERQDSGQILDSIEKANLFIFPLDDELRWYHYHPLFRDLLLHTLGNTHPEMISGLHHRASEWYERENFFPLAITHVLKAQDYDRAAHLIEQRAGEIFMQGELAAYLGWMDSFPKSIIQTHPSLIIHRIFVETLLTGLSLGDIEARLQEVEKLDPQGNLKGVMMVVRAVALGNQADNSQNPEFCQKALELLPPESSFWRSVTIISAGQFRLLSGDIPDIPTAIKLFNEAIETSQKQNSLLAVALALRCLAETYIAAGRLHQARDCYQQILDSALNKQGQLLPIASFGLIGLGKLYREWNDLDTSLNHLEKGIILESGNLGLWYIDGLLELVRTKQALGDLEGASQLLQKARQLFSKFPAYRDQKTAVSTMEISLALAQGDLKQINILTENINQAELLKSIAIEGEVPRYISLYPAHEKELLTLVKAYIARNTLAEALKILDALSKNSQRLGRSGIMLEANILYALAYKALGDPGKALDHLKQVLLAAEPEGYVRSFLDAGPAISSLLYEAAQQGITQTYVHRLIASFPVSEATPRRAEKSVKMEEPLSDRELDVLSLIAKGLSNKEIGERLYIETRTVKWHTSNIIGKLGVKNRTEAVAKARELGLITEHSASHPKPF